jgi:hypothetical protein
MKPSNEDANYLSKFTPKSAFFFVRGEFSSLGDKKKSNAIHRKELF